MRAALGSVRGRCHLLVGGLAAALALPAAAGAVDTSHELFASPVRDGRSVEGLIDLDEVPITCHLADGRAIAGWVTYDAKQDSTFVSVPDIVELDTGLLIGTATVQWHTGKDGKAVPRQHELPVVGKAAVKESYVEWFDEAGNAVDIDQTLSEKFGWKGVLREGSESTSTSLKYSYASSPRGVRESGTLATKHGDVHNGKASVSIDDTTRSLGLFRGVDPVLQGKPGQFGGAAVFDTGMPTDAMKTGTTFTGGTFTLAVKPLAQDNTIGLYKSSAKVGTRTYSALGALDIDEVDVTDFAELEAVFEKGSGVFISVYRVRTPAAQESYKAAAAK